MGWRFIGFVGAICAVFQGVRVWNFCIWLVWKSMGKVFFSRGKLCGQILGAFSFHHFHRVSCKSFFFLPFYKKRKAYIYFILFGILLGIVEKGDFCEARLRLGKAKSKNHVFHFALLSPCTNFREVRLRLGKAKSKNHVFRFALLSPCTIFAEAISNEINLI